MKSPFVNGGVFICTGAVQQQDFTCGSFVRSEKQPFFINHNRHFPTHQRQSKFIHKWPKVSCQDVRKNKLIIYFFRLVTTV